MRKPLLYFLGLIGLFFSSCASNETQQERSPKVKLVGVVSPQVIKMNIQEGEMAPSFQLEYVAQEGDSIHERISSAGNGLVTERILYRGGKAYGWLTGEGNHRLTVGQHLVGDTLNGADLTDIKNYLISSKDDPNYAQPQRPLAVYQKSKANNWLEPNREFTFLHQLYFKLAKPLKNGATYQIATSNINIYPQTSELKYDNKVINEAIHLSGLGFQLEDASKIAYLSEWMGTGGAFDFDQCKTFKVINLQDQSVAFTGEIKKVLAENEVEKMRNPKNFAKTNVYQLNFGQLQQAGEFAIEIPGYGRSMSFKIGQDTWANNMRYAMKGFYNMRANSGQEAKYGGFDCPPAYVPGKDIVTYQSNASLLNTGNGLNAKGLDTDNFGQLILNKTDVQIVEKDSAIGGYHDAGDWDRRAQHMLCGRWQLELYQLFPDLYKHFNTGIPESNNSLPDLIDEVRFNLDFYRRLQTKEGGIRGGLEAIMHPVEGETSYQESLESYVYAPDMWSSFIYAGVAARLAFVLRHDKPELAKMYKNTALKAYQWGSKRFDLAFHNKIDQPLPVQVFCEKSQAALELFQLTQQHQYMIDFLEFSVLNPQLKLENFGKGKAGWDHVLDYKTLEDMQSDALFLYSLLPPKYQQKSQLRKCKQIIQKRAQVAMDFQKNNAFNLAATDPERPMMVGFFTVPQAKDMVRAHYLTKENKYLQATYRACDFATGANPMNTVFMTGVSDRSIQNCYHPDSRLTGQKMTMGIIPYGPFDLDDPVCKDSEFFKWPVTYYLDNVDVPKASDFPVYEVYHDVYRWIMMNEWTPMETEGPNSYIWGYLAGVNHHQHI